MPGFGVRLALPSLVLVSELGKVFALFINKHPWFLNKIYFYLKLSARVVVCNSIFVILSHTLRYVRKSRSYGAETIDG